ncbi:MAG: transposase [Undibacterium sp.]|nr:transposase [Opitutaceae bacterium]
MPGTKAAETEYQTLGWPHPRRLILSRHRVAERPGAGGKKLIEVPGYLFQALVTSLPASEPPLAVWRYYNGRADGENVIKELQQGFALTTLCLRSFRAIKAALSLAALTYNLTVLFQRHLGWQTKPTVSTLRFRLFLPPGILAHPAGKTAVKLALPPSERNGWRRLWGKILFPFPNCNAVETTPAFSS